MEIIIQIFSIGIFVIFLQHRVMSQTTIQETIPNPPFNKIQEYHETSMTRSSVNVSLVAELNPSLQLKKTHESSKQSVTISAVNESLNTWPLMETQKSTDKTAQVNDIQNSPNETVTRFYLNESLNTSPLNASQKSLDRNNTRSSMNYSSNTFTKYGGYNIDADYFKTILNEDRSLDDLSIQDFYKEQDLLSNHLTLELYADRHTAMVHVNDKQVYYMHNVTVKIDEKHTIARQQGIHMLVLHPHTGRVMNEMHHMTRQPIAYRGLIAALKKLGRGRLVVLVAVGSWRDYMPDEADDILADTIGSILSPNVAIGEMWVCVATVGGPLWAEAVTPIKPFNNGTGYSTPITMALTVPKSSKDRGCHWYNDPNLAKRAQFCEMYEGYGEFCDCQNPEVVSPQQAAPLAMQENIPIVSITSRRQYKLLGQLRQLFRQAGGGQTPILLSVDGLQEEAKDFAEAMGLEAIFHRNLAKPGTNVRINEHIKFSILHGFLHFKDADKIIILEDDLLLSPDFISYFHQTAPLLDTDDSIFAINAFNYNSFAPFAVDSSRLYRANTFPAYGWMVNRRWAQEILPQWAPASESVDWDWWLRGFTMRGRSIIAPEVARTFHQGYGGVHVTGWEQALFFDRRPLNKDPNVKLNISYLQEANYDAYLRQEITNGKQLIIKEHPCLKEYIPKHKVGSFVIFFSMVDYSDEDTFFALHGCLGAYERGRMENYKFLYSFGYYGNHVYTIGCPVSPYCRSPRPPDPGSIYKATKEERDKTTRIITPLQTKDTLFFGRSRVPALSLVEEFNIGNILLNYIPGSYRLSQPGNLK